MIAGRRGFLKAGLAGVAGLSLTDLLAQRAQGASPRSPRSVILLWMAGGPSHLDMWDPKPDRPLSNRGPFGVIDTRLPGVQISEHLPKMAAALNRFTLIRAVDCAGSNHDPNIVMQTGNRRAEPRTNAEARMYPAIASLCAMHRGGNAPGMPPYVAFYRSRTHVATGGYAGREFDPFPGHLAADLPVVDLLGKDLGRSSGGALFALPESLTLDRVRRRNTLRQQVDALRRTVDESPEVHGADRYQQQAVEMLLGGGARAAFDIHREPDVNRRRYGSHPWHQQALLARRLVEAGVAFVTLDLTHHSASGTWDTHGDDVPPYGGIQSGLKPLLPIFDHLITTLVADLEERGLLSTTLVIAMGEFGRTPQISAADGRDHWDRVMSMALAGGGLRHGQVIGRSTPDGGEPDERPVTPGDLAATIFRHMDVPLDATYQDHQGKPVPIVQQGEPLRELF